VLIGATPITTVIEKNTLNAFYNIARHEDFIEHEIARSQLAIKDENSNSWFTYIRKLLQKYNLPTAYEIMGNPLTKGQWKELLNKEIDKYWKTMFNGDKDTIIYIYNMSFISLRHRPLVFTAFKLPYSLTCLL
jgi:hypothetical protein